MLSSPKSPQWGLVSIIAARNAHTGLVGRRLPGRRGASAEGRRSASAARHPSCPGETLSPPPAYLPHLFRFANTRTCGDGGHPECSGNDRVRINLCSHADSLGAHWCDEKGVDVVIRTRLHGKEKWIQPEKMGAA